MRLQRRFSYFPMGTIRVTNRLSGDAMGTVGDMSSGGMRLIAKQPLAVGGCYEMQLHVPERGGEAALVNVKVICQWSRKHPSRPLFFIGCALDQPSEGYQELVSRLATGRR